MQIYLGGVVGLVALGLVAIGARGEAPTVAPADLAVALRGIPIQQSVLTTAQIGAQP